MTDWSLDMTACVVVPVYRARPASHEVVSLTQLQAKLGQHSIEPVAPAALNLEHYRRLVGDRSANYFDDRYFEARADSRASYSALMVSDGFYRRFERYEYILIYQTDAFVFTDQLERWTKRQFDIGSPHWAGWGARKDLGMVGVGNGGFSLRRVEAFAKVLGESRRPVNRMRVLKPRSPARALRRARKGELVEDYYWGYFAPIRVASIEDAIEFAFEMGLERMAAQYRNLVPFGCHAVWNLEYIDAIRNGVPPNREPEYEAVLRSLLERSNNLSCTKT
jgi:hypothetical protein